MVFEDAHGGFETAEEIGGGVGHGGVVELVGHKSQVAGGFGDFRVGGVIHIDEGGAGIGGQGFEGAGGAATGLGESGAVALTGAHGHAVVHHQHRQGFAAAHPVSEIPGEGGAGHGQGRQQDGERAQGEDDHFPVLHPPFGFAEAAEYELNGRELDQPRFAFEQQVNENGEHGQGRESREQGGEKHHRPDLPAATRIRRTKYALRATSMGVRVLICT